jgi:hypothetical protein
MEFRFSELVSQAVDSLPEAGRSMRLTASGFIYAGGICGPQESSPFQIVKKLADITPQTGTDIKVYFKCWRGEPRWWILVTPTSLSEQQVVDRVKPVGD